MGTFALSGSRQETETTTVVLSGPSNDDGFVLTIYINLPSLPNLKISQFKGFLVASHTSTTNTSTTPTHTISTCFLQFYAPIY